MRNITLILILAFFSNQVLAFYPHNDDDLKIDESIEKIEKGLKTKSANTNVSQKSPRPDKLIRQIEKEIQKVSEMTEEQEAIHLERILKRSEKRFKRTSRQLKRVAKKDRFVKKLAMKSGLSTAEVKRSFLDQAKTFAPVSMLKLLNEEIAAAGSYLNFLNDKLHEAKRLAAQVAKTGPKQGRYVANTPGLTITILTALYLLITPFFLIGGFIMTLVGLAILLITGGAVGIVAVIGLSIFAVGIPGIILAYL